MRVTADGDLVPLFDVILDHGRFLLDDVHDGQYYLVGILLGQLLAVLEPLDHVLDELDRHLAFQLWAVVLGFEGHVLDIQPFCRRGSIVDLDGLQEGISLDDALTLGHAQLRVRIVRGLLYDELPIAEGFAVLEHGRVRRGAAVVCLKRE
jgi:hypothetical protein